MEMAKQKVEGKPTVGVDVQKMRFVKGGFSRTNSQLTVPGGRWMGTKKTLLVYRNIIFELVVNLQPCCDPLFATMS